MIWNEADYRWRTCEHAGDSKIWPESPRLDSRRSGCKLCDFELNINAFSGLLFCYLENKGAKLVDRFPPPLNTYDINCKSFSFFFKLKHFRNTPAGNGISLIQVTNLICLFSHKWGNITEKMHGLGDPSQLSLSSSFVTLLARKPWAICLTFLGFSSVK